MKYQLLLIMIIIFSFLSGCARNTVTPTVAPTIPVTNTPSPPAGTVVWTMQTNGPIYSSPAVDEDTVYFGSDDGWLYAAEAVSGEVRWKFETQGLVRSRPAIADGIVYSGSRNPWLYALDAKTGKQLWRYPYNGSWVESSAIVVDGVVYVGSSDAKGS